MCFIKIIFSSRQDMDPLEELHFLKTRNKNVTNFQGDITTMVEYLGIERCPEALKDFFRTINQVIYFYFLLVIFHIIVTYIAFLLMGKLLIIAYKSGRYSF